MSKLLEEINDIRKRAGLPIVEQTSASFERWWKKHLKQLIEHEFGYDGDAKRYFEDEYGYQPQPNDPKFLDYMKQYVKESYFRFIRITKKELTAPKKVYRLIAVPKEQAIKILRGTSEQLKNTKLGTHWSLSIEHPQHFGGIKDVDLLFTAKVDISQVDLDATALENYRVDGMEEEVTLKDGVPIQVLSVIVWRPRYIQDQREYPFHKIMRV